ncbi:HRDC domain-containing protein [Propionibacteriaceae bacterium Y1923]|uniref:HRDC domain-containing protein n=1 Tax=Aestuariimicrobium sp. Y1814 TaxID=3418742 RepID=UPI003C13F66D
MDADEQLPVLEAPREGLPPLVSTAQALDETVGALAAGAGPVAVDAERAQGFRYSGRAYLLQFRRQGSGTHLVDPIPFADKDPESGLEPLAEALEPTEWILHAASQDLPCLRECGLYPHSLFDTELAGRLLGLERVGLGAMIERYFGLTLRKEHSAANWSMRPLPEDWLVYAALDVELLVELREVMATELVEAGKDEWARQEFDHVLASFASPAAPRVDPWRRTSGIIQVKSGLGLAVVRELWQARDEIARANDTAPSKVLPDRAISELAAGITKTGPLPSRHDLRAIEGFRRRQAKRYESSWVAALDRVAALPKGGLPPTRSPHTDGPPAPKTWERNAPEAHARWGRVRPAVNELAEELHLPSENLLTPDTLRRITYAPPDDRSPQGVDERLDELGSRPWQRELVVGVLAEGLQDD